jgi:hypothetical protein
MRVNSREEVAVHLTERGSKKVYWSYRFTRLLISALSILFVFGLLGIQEGVLAQTDGDRASQPISAPASLTPDLTPETQVLAYDDAKNDWEPTVLTDLAKGQEFQFGEHLCHVDQDGLVRMNPDVAAEKLADADRAYEKDNWRFPEAGDVVRFIDKENGHVRHDRMGTLTEGDRFWFQGRLYETVASPKGGPGLCIRNTGIVLGRVTNTYKRRTDTVVDLTVADAQGKELVITGTPAHPFFVQAVNDYIPMSELKAGTVLKTTDGSLATVRTSRIQHGEFDVFNFEVEGQHSYYVSSPDSGPAVLVHNQCEMSPLQRMHSDEILMSTSN